MKQSVVIVLFAVVLVLVSVVAEVDGGKKGGGKGSKTTTTTTTTTTLTLVQIYQWWHPTKRNYYYGTDSETAAVESAGYTSKTPSFSLAASVPKKQKGLVAVYRFKNTNGVLLSTAKKVDKTLGMTLDKVIGYASTKMSVSQSAAVYQYTFTSGSTSFYFTTSRAQGDSSGYQYSKVVFYTSLSASAPVVQPSASASASYIPPAPAPSVSSAPQPGSTLPATFNALDRWNLRSFGILDQGTVVVVTCSL